jgi:hypothetical protein
MQSYQSSIKCWYQVIKRLNRVEKREQIRTGRVAVVQGSQAARPAEERQIYFRDRSKWKMQSMGLLEDLLIIQVLRHRLVSSFSDLLHN